MICFATTIQAEFPIVSSRIDSAYERRIAGVAGISICFGFKQGSHACAQYCNGRRTILLCASNDLFELGPFVFTQVLVCAL